MVWYGIRQSSNVQGCVPDFLENKPGVSSPGPFWLLGGAWSQCMYGGSWWGGRGEGVFSIKSCLLMFHGVRSFMMIQNSEFEPPASGFQSQPLKNSKTSLSAQHRRQNP